MKVNYYVGPDDAVPDMLKQGYSLEMEYDLLHNISEKNQIHQFGSVSTINQSLPAEARHALTSYKLEYSGYGNSPYAHGQPHAPRRITEYPQEDYSGDPDDPRIKRKHIAYDANGNQLEIREEVKDPGSPQGYHLQSLRKNLWDAEDRLRAVDLSPENDADKPLVAIYTYDAGGERTIKYVPARIDARYSAKEAGSADRLAATIYPSALLTAKILPIPEEGYGKGGRRVLKYTKHYYIGSERIASFLGTKQSVGLYCDFKTTLIPPVDAKVLEAGQALENVFTHFDKTIDLDTPYLYGSNSRIICAPARITQGFGAYWYHPDHLGSSSYITNLQGKISQHMEYLPFGETLVEEHLNSNNSPYKFNAKEFDSETGNYYYGARYYDPKWSIWLSVDPLAEKYPDWSPFAYTFQNPINFIDPDGRDGIRIIDKKNKTITIKAIYYVQTEDRMTKAGAIPGYSPKQVAKMDAKINNWYNKQDLSVTEGEYEGYSLKFDLSFKEGGNTMETRISADSEQFEGHSIGNSLERGNSISDPHILSLNEDGDPVGGVTDSKKYITMNNEHDSRTNQRHEVGHTLGLDDNVKTGSKGGLMEYPP